MRNFLPLLFLTICVCATGKSQTKSTVQPYCAVTEYSTSDGIAHRRITGIQQDKNGLMWLGTWNGLTKFDGYSFVSYKTSSDSPFRLKNSRLNFIQVNPSGDVWCGTNDMRIYLFDTDTETYIDILSSIEKQTKRTNVISRVFSLDKGVTWILCDQGYCYRADDNLCKEGNGIKYYGYDDKSLPGRVNQVFQDKEGDEWILTDKGVSIVGRKKISTATPFDFVEHKDSTEVLISREGMVGIYTYSNNRLKIGKIPYNIGRIHNIKGIDRNTTALCTDRGLILHELQRNNFILFDLASTGIASNDVSNAFPDSRGDIWLFTKTQGVVRIERKSGRIKHYAASPQKRPNNTNFIYEDSRGELFIMPTDGRFSWYDRDSDTLRDVVMDTKESEYCYAPIVVIDYVDRQGNLWLIPGSGVNKVVFSGKGVDFFELDKDHETRALMIDSEGKMWVGTKSGMLRVYDKSGDSFSYVSSGGKFLKSPRKFSESGIYAIMEDSRGNIWVGTKGNGLYLLRDRESGGYRYAENYVNDRNNAYSLGNNDIYALLEDRRNNVWIGTFNGGLNLADMNSDRSIRFINQNNRLKTYPSADFQHIRHLCQTDSVILVATTGGLLTFSYDFADQQKITFFRNTYSAEQKSGLSGNNIMHIMRSRSGEIYLAALDGTLNTIESSNLLSDNLKFGHFSKNDINDFIPVLPLSIVEDNTGIIWITSDDAIIKFDPAVRKFEQFSRSHLMLNNYFTEAPAIIDSRGRLVAGAADGIAVIDPQKLENSTYKPNILFTSVEIQGEESKRSVHDNKVTLKKNQRNITISFAALDYVNSRQICYAYRMIGLEDKWSYAENNRAINYANLPKGEYRFQVKSTNGDGIWVENTNELRIIVKPRFGETVWALMLYVALAGLIVCVILYILFYIYRLRYKLSFEQQIAEVKLRFFTDISHELRTPLTLVAAPVSEVMQDEKLPQRTREFLQVAHNNINRMLNLVNQLLDFRKIQSNKMNLIVENCDIAELTRTIANNFDTIARQHNIVFNVETGSEPLFCWVDCDKFEKILLNLLSNAFKYTLDGQSVTVKINSTEKEIAICVADTGIGISQRVMAKIFERYESFSYNAHSSGIGLSLAKELAELHHAAIDVRSVLGKGSEFTLRLQRGMEHFANDSYVELLLDDAASSAHDNLFSSEENIPNRYDCEVLKILVVEDNTELCNFISTVLSETYQVIKASNGADGLRKVLQEIPDFIITDVMMPQMNGLDMVRAIKENPDVCHIPIVVLSAKASLEDRISGFEHDIDDYITKPFSATYLKTRISTIIRQRRLLQERFKSAISHSGIDSFEIIPSQPNIVPFDKQLMQKIVDYIEANIDNSKLAVDDIADAVGLSRSIFYRKIKSVVGLSPIDFIREFRIKRAAQLIDTGEFTLSEIAYMTGFGDPRYFAKCFKRQLGINPSEYRGTARGL